MSRHRLVLALATGLSLLLHLALVGGDRLTLPRALLPDDDVLVRRPPPPVQRVRLLRPPAATGGTTPATAPEVSARTPARPAALPDAAPRSVTASPDAAIQVTPDAPATTVAEARTGETDTPAVGPEPATPPVQSDPAPAFPLQLAARLEASLGHREGRLLQIWRMEGLRYAIAVQTESAPLDLQLSSEGAVHPEGGLTPSRSALVVGKRLQSVTEYEPGRITLGQAVHRRTYPLPVVPQDLASLPFQLAVTFAGQPQTIFVSSGSALHQVRFTLVAEETLRLPAGRVRTLHLTGEQFHPGLREMVQAYDVWLAPDFLNFPVKVRGHLPDGTPFGYRLLSLDIEGQRVLGPVLAGTVKAPDGRAGPAPAAK